jgi:hypothetical protein
MNNDNGRYQIICNNLLEKYGLECEVRDLYEDEYFIYVKKFDIKCTFKNIHLPIMHCVDRVASYCYKEIPKHYIDLVKIILRGDKR